MKTAFICLPLVIRKVGLSQGVTFIWFSPHASFLDATFLLSV